MSNTLPSARRAVSRVARDTPRTMGVYAIRDRASGYLVVQASPNLDGAINRHRFELRLGSHRDRRLQAAWSERGESAIDFDVIELIRPKPDPSFDAAEALALALTLWRAELLPAGAPT